MSTATLSTADGTAPVTRTSTAASRFAFVVFWLLLAALLFSCIGLALAVIGWFRPAVVAGLTVIVAARSARLLWAPVRSVIKPNVEGGLAPVIAVIILALLAATSASAFAGEHLLADRDPAIYLNTGRWLADEGTLLVEGQVGGFEGIEEITSDSPGFYQAREDGTLDPQFLHLLPVWAAAAHWVGGDQALLRVNALLIALALLAVWLLAAILLRPWFAVLAPAGIAVLLPTVYFSRDLYSEPLAMMFVFGGIAFVTLARSAQRWSLSFVAGLMVGGVAMERIDGWLVVIAMVAYLTAEWWWVRETAATDRTDRFVKPALLGIVVGGGIGLFDGLVRSRIYLVERAEPIGMMFGLLVIVLLAAFVALRWPALVRRGLGWASRNRATIGWAAAAMVVLSAAMFFVRPLFQQVHEANHDPSIANLQELEGLAIDATRSYFEWSLHWLSWYLGFGALVLGVVGLAWGWRKAVLGSSRLWPFLLTVSLTTFVYLLSPSITPDHLWAMRRFLPVVLPGVVVAAVLATQWMFERSQTTAIRLAVLSLSILLLIPVPAALAWPLRDVSPYSGVHDAIEAACAAIPEGGAVLLTTRLAGRVQPSIRGFCGVPVAGIRSERFDAVCVIGDAREAWAAAGVPLMVGFIDELTIPSEVTVVADYQVAEYTLSRRPERVIDRSFTMRLGDADLVDTSHCG